MIASRPCSRPDEHEPHHADDLQWLSKGYDCPGVHHPNRPRPHDSDHVIGDKLLGWMLDESPRLPDWAQELLTEAARRLGVDT